MGERPTWPTHAEVAQSLIEQHAEDRFSSLVGTIQSYDPATQRADVVVGVRNPYQDPDGTGYLLREDFPVLPSVKVLFPRMGRWFMAMSVQPGDPVMLLFNTLSSEDWMNGDGRVVDVTDTRRQHVSHAVALLGMNVNSEALNHAPTSSDPASDPQASTVWGSDLNDGTRITIYGSGAVKITRGADVVFQTDADGTNHLGGPEGQAIATAQAVTSTLDALKNAFAAWTPTSVDGAAIKAIFVAWAATVTGATKAKAT